MAVIGGQLPRGYARVKVYGIDPTQIVVNQQSGSFGILLDGSVSHARSALKDVEAYINAQGATTAIDALQVNDYDSSAVCYVTPMRVRQVGDEWVNAADGTPLKGYNLYEPDEVIQGKIENLREELLDLWEQRKAIVRQAKELARSMQRLT